TMIGTLIRGRVSVAGAAGNATKTALTIALRYAETRRQFARPGERQEVLLLDYLAHQRKLLPALAKTYALHFTQQELVAALHDSAETETETETVTETVTDDAERSRRELESRAAGIKAVTTWHATATIALCREACGGAGYLAENRLPALKADTDVFTTFEGDNTVLLQLVAKGLLTNFQVHFEELDTVGMTKFIAESVLDTVLERTAARPLIERLISAVSGTEESLTDRGWQLRAFRDRERHVLGGLARRLRRATEPDTDSFAIFNQAQDHVLRAGRVHVERILLEAFVSAVQDCADPASAALLDQVCELFALSSIESDLAWFLGHDRISAARARTVARLVNERCAALRPQAGLLVDALGVPESCVAAAIATGAEHKRQQEQAEHE
ncbi:MAG: acyl-CoA dehydrogenase, partial [Sciscionella sp.]